MIAQICTKIELTFWNWAIPTLSNSQKVHRLIRHIRTIADGQNLRWFAVRAALAGTAGLVCGFSGYFLFIH